MCWKGADARCGRDFDSFSLQFSHLAISVSGDVIDQLSELLRR